MKNTITSVLALFFLGCTLMCLESCNNDDFTIDEIEKSDSNATYFDVLKWKNEELQRMSNINDFKIAKKVTSSEGFEEIIFEKNSFPWQYEFSIFEDADINKPTFKGLYKTEDIENGIRYTSTNNRLKVRSLSIIFNEKSEVLEFNATIHKQNLLYASEYKLGFTRDIGYTIHNEQVLKIINKKSFYTIEGTFIFAEN